MSSSNYRRNKAAVDQFRKELMAMVEDIGEIDIRVLDRAVNEGVDYAKDFSPVDTGFFKENWSSAPAVRSKAGCASKTLVNTAEYASYVNYGHKTVDAYGNITGYVKSEKGDHLLEKTQNEINRRMIALFEKEVEAVQNRHNP